MTLGGAQKPEVVIQRYMEEVAPPADEVLWLHLIAFLFSDSLRVSSPLTSNYSN